LAQSRIKTTGNFPQIPPTSHFLQAIASGRWSSHAAFAFVASSVADGQLLAVEFALSEGDTLTHLVECKLSDARPHRVRTRFAEQRPQSKAVQLLRECKAESDIGWVQVRDGAGWLAGLEV